MSLLKFRQVSMRCESADDVHGALRDVSLEVNAGELVVVWGACGCERMELLRLAAGMTAPDRGSISFKRASLRSRPALGAPAGIACAMSCFELLVGSSVLDQVAAPLLARGYSIRRARAFAQSLLARVDAAAYATVPTAKLNHGERIRVAIARALSTAPALVVGAVDGLDAVGTQAEVLGLLRSIARRDAIAFLLTTDGTSGLSVADRALALDRGRCTMYADTSA